MVQTTTSPAQPSGFTLVELIIAVAVIGIVSTYALTDYRAAQRRADVRLQAYALAATLRQAQNYSLGAYEHNGAVPTGGWGVRTINASSYAFFADVNGNYLYDGGAEAVSNGTKTLPGTVTFPAASQGQTFVFRPPNPTTYLNGANTGSLTVTLQQADNVANTHTVTVNAFGLVDVN